jgi:hypothetical protein
MPQHNTPGTGALADRRRRGTRNSVKTCCVGDDSEVGVWAECDVRKGSVTNSQRCGRALSSCRRTPDSRGR